MSVSNWSGIDSRMLYVNGAVTSSRLGLDQRLRHLSSKYLTFAPTGNGRASWQRAVNGREAMIRSRCADDFATIRSRMTELRDQRPQSAQNEDARSVAELSLHRDNNNAVSVQKPGIPGWRVSRRKR